MFDNGVYFEFFGGRRIDIVKFDSHIENFILPITSIRQFTPGFFWILELVKFVFDVAVDEEIIKFVESDLIIFREIFLECFEEPDVPFHKFMVIKYFFQIADIHGSILRIVGISALVFFGFFPGSSDNEFNHLLSGFLKVHYFMTNRSIVFPQHLVFSHDDIIHFLVDCFLFCWVVLQQFFDHFSIG